jgi:ubiquinone/menaquinone biosynthesis C-methylase UbiE
LPPAADVETIPLLPAAAAFNAVAEVFDDRFGGWESVAAQRRAVRAELARAFVPGAHVLEIGGGTGEDALWLAQRDREVTLTDPSPGMIRVAAAKLRSYHAPAPRLIAAEALETMTTAPFDGAFSNFAALNCVADLHAVARGLAPLIRPGGRVLLVVFGVCAPGEWVTQLARGDVRAVFRRSVRGEVQARLGGRPFPVRYHRRRDLIDAFASTFRFVSRRGIGVFVPPSAAEPWITSHPRLLSALERMDRVASRPLAMLGDHVLYEFERLEGVA